MRYVFLSCLFAFLCFSCGSSYEKKDLYGSWKGDTWQFVFNEDGTCFCGQSAAGYPCTYRTIGNALEINATEFQLSNVSVQSIKNDTLTLVMRVIGTDQVHKLRREK